MVAATIMVYSFQEAVVVPTVVSIVEVAVAVTVLVLSEAIQVIIVTLVIIRGYVVAAQTEITVNVSSVVVTATETTSMHLLTATTHLRQTIMQFTHPCISQHSQKPMTTHCFLF